MTNQLIKSFEAQYLKTNFDKIKPGLIVKVYQKIKEGNKERIQVYEGLVIKVRGTGVAKTMTVRKIMQGVGVEKVFPLQSDLVDKIEILRESQVRRSKLYYMRDRAGKSARLKGKQMAEMFSFGLVVDEAKIEQEKEESIASAKEEIEKKEQVEGGSDEEVANVIEEIKEEAK